MASYNCSDSTDSAYGGGGYGTCTGQSVGAPNTGIFSPFLNNGDFTIAAPFVVAICIATVSLAISKRRKQKSKLASSAKE